MENTICANDSHNTYRNCVVRRRTYHNTRIVHALRTRRVTAVRLHRSPGDVREFYRPAPAQMADGRHSFDVRNASIRKRSVSLCIGYFFFFYWYLVLTKIGNKRHACTERGDLNRTMWRELGFPRTLGFSSNARHDVFLAADASSLTRLHVTIVSRRCVPFRCSAPMGKMTVKKYHCRETRVFGFPLCGEKEIQIDELKKKRSYDRK